MSILAALFGWTKLPQWGLELIAVAAVGLSVWWWHHETFEKGIAAQRASDTAAAAPLFRAADIQTKAWQIRATEAEASNAKAQSDLALYRAARPIVYRVCFDAHGSGFGVSEAAALGAGTEGGATAAALGQSVPAANPVVSEDRGPLLDAFAALFDTQDDTLREFQARDGVRP